MEASHVAEDQLDAGARVVGERVGRLSVEAFLVLHQGVRVGLCGVGGHVLVLLAEVCRISHEVPQVHAVLLREDPIEPVPERLSLFFFAPWHVERQQHGEDVLMILVAHHRHRVTICGLRWALEPFRRVERNTEILSSQKVYTDYQWGQADARGIFAQLNSGQWYGPGPRSFRERERERERESSTCHERSQLDKIDKLSKLDLPHMFSNARKDDSALFRR